MVRGDLCGGWARVLESWGYPERTGKWLCKARSDGRERELAPSFGVRSVPHPCDAAEATTRLPA